MQALLFAKEAWQKAQDGAAGGRPAKASQAETPGKDRSLAMDAGQGEIDLPPPSSSTTRKFYFRRAGVLLTYFLDNLDHFHALLLEQKSQNRSWGVRRWCTTCEKCSDTERLHAHAMLQFWGAKDRASDAFILAGVKPNVSPADLCGDSSRGRFPQECIDRGMFYVWADKIGTVHNEAGEPVVHGNYFPCWVKGGKGRFEKYPVQGSWPEKLWKLRKLSFERFEEYLFLSRDGVVSKKRNMDAVRSWEREAAERKEMRSTVERIRGSPVLYRSFPSVPPVVL